MKKKIKFLFPVPSIVVLAILGILLKFGTINGRSIRIDEWISFMVFFFAFIILPLDAIIFVYRKIVYKIKEISFRKKENKSNTIDKENSVPIKEDGPEEYKKAIDSLSKKIESQSQKIASIENSLVGFSESNHERKEYDNQASSVSKNSFDNTDCAPKDSIKTHRTIYVDSLFEEAGRLIIEKDKASAGMLQRAFKIGFNRAERIMNQLEYAGVVDIEEGTRPRKVLMGMDMFQEFLNSVEVKRRDEKITYGTKQNVVESSDKIVPGSNSFNRISMYNNKIDYMEGHDFETYCAVLLEKNNFYNVKVTQGSGDQGIDIIAQKDGIKYGIQCKCYSSDIGNKAVQEAFAGKTFYNCHVAAVLTNRYFTTSAKELAEKNGVLLWDRDYLELLISNAKI